MSIQPKWCELIASGKKTVEVRKTKPKLETPFKVYIYETKGKKQYFSQPMPIPYNEGKGKVIGEFVCDSITHYDAELWDAETFECIREIYEPDDFTEYGEYEYKIIASNEDDDWKQNPLVKTSCVSIEELRKYLGQEIHDFYAWHISDLVIYDKSKELSEFRLYNCRVEFENGYPIPTHTIKRPPQSWCYVEGV